MITCPPYKSTIFLKPVPCDPLNLIFRGSNIFPPSSSNNFISSLKFPPLIPRILAIRSRTWPGGSSSPSPLDSRLHLLPDLRRSAPPRISTPPACVTNCNRSLEKVAATCYEASRMVQLPTELTIEIASRVAAQSEDAMADLGNLHATCKAMCVVCSAAKVG